MKKQVVLIGISLLLPGYTTAQQVDFCGELVPMERDFVSYRLMDVIKRNPRYQGYSPALRLKAEQYFPIIEPILPIPGAAGF